MTTCFSFETNDVARRPGARRPNDEPRSLETNAARDSLETNAARDSLETNGALGSFETNAARDSLETNAARDSLETNAARDSLETNAARDSLETNGALGSFEANAARDSLETNGAPDSLETRPAAQPRTRNERELGARLIALLPELRARAMRLCGDRAAADDLVQDTIERALRFSAQYEGGTNLRAWAYQILFSVFVTRYRRSRRERLALRSLACDPLAWTTPVAFAPAETAASLTAATREQLDALPAGFRAVVELVDLEEQSYREAAAHLGLPVGTVMSRLHRGRKLLAMRLGDVTDPAAAAA